MHTEIGYVQASQGIRLIKCQNKSPNEMNVLLNFYFYFKVPQVRLSGEAKDLIVTCCNEFIHLLASEANNVCEKQSKKLILPDHVLLALDNLGFSEYKQDCLEVMKQMQEETDKRKKFSNKLEKSGIPEEELLRQQSELFAEARKQHLMENADEWSKYQQAAQEALQRQTSTTSVQTPTHLASSASLTSTSSVSFSYDNVNALNLNSISSTNQMNSFNNNNYNHSVSINNSSKSNDKNENDNKNNDDDDDDNYD